MTDCRCPACGDLDRTMIGSESDDVASFERAELERELVALRAVRDLLVAICGQFEHAVQEAERPKGGQHVSPSGGDFWPVPIGVVQRMRWWAREFRRALAALPDGET